MFSLRKILGGLLIASVLILIADVMAVMIKRIRSVVLKDAYVKIFRAEMLALSAMLLCVLDIRTGFLSGFDSPVLNTLGTAVRIMLMLFSAVVAFFLIRVAVGGSLRSKEDTDCAIVLGMALINGKPSMDLIYRVNAAKRYLDDHPLAFIILTGGNPDSSGTTEAMMMKDLLLKKGADEKRIRLENMAGTTDENFIFSAALTDRERPVAVITSSYHMERALMAAKNAGFTDLKRYPARSDFITYGASVMWETVLILRDCLKGH
ncbi:MAG: YdcF family protein [Christensenellaceae bacterium]|nr:YdcF family protein [Christensenellaceae bacterium]